MSAPANTEAAPMTQTLKEAALEWAAAGFAVFPCAPDAKNPITPNGFKDATTDPEQIETWWDETPDANIGWYPDASSHSVLDVDLPKKPGDPDGRETLEGLVAINGPLPETFRVRTPHGGTHYYFDGACPSSGSRIGPKVDTRGIGGYVLVPPSVVEGKPYVVEHEADLAEVPQWIVEGAFNRSKALGAPAPDIPLDLDINIMRAAQCLQSRINRGDVSISDHGGNNTMYRVACQIEDFGLSKEKTLELLRVFNKECKPPWCEEDLQRFVENSGRYRQNAVGAYANQPVEEAFADQWDAIIEASHKPRTGSSPQNEAEPETRAQEIPPPLTGRQLAEGEFPRAEFLIEGLILKNNVNLIHGDGGAGKTLLAEHLAVAVASQSECLGRTTQQAPVLLVLAEDGAGETKARLNAICHHLGVNLADLPIRVWALPGYDITLASVTDEGQIRPAPMLARLKAALRDHPGSLVILDSLADIAVLNEAQRQPVNAFLKRTLGGLCTEFHSTVVVLAHPSKASQADGTLFSGSTAFNNAVRNRLTLEHPDKTSSRRVLTVAKSNYASAGTEIDLFLFGEHVFLTAGDTAHEDRERAEYDAVLSVALAMIDRDIAIVKGNGSGQKPRDVAAEVQKRHRIKIDAKRVLAILHQAERDGVLEYRAGGNSRRGQKAGFVRREKSQ
jgi:RecA-family ATPase